MATRKYPIGIQTFSELRTKGFLYIDKTEYIYDLVTGNSKYVFLGRPRRFGKSLLTSTLHCYFEGRKELFEGLAIEKLETEWEKYPVLHFDLSTAKHLDAQSLEDYLITILKNQEKVYGCEEDTKYPNIRLMNLIRRACEQTGKQVVVLFDEYDAPLLDVAHEDENLTKLRQIMRNFYSPLKACDPYLKFVFFTGITKFSQLSIFSELNNINNITMWDRYAGICGITKEELLTTMSEDIDLLAEHQGITREEAIEQLKFNYDGYHFTPNCPDIFNPFSLLNCFDRMEFGSYWFASGTPTFLIEMMRKFKTMPTDFGVERRAAVDDFDAPIQNMRSITPLLYQSGYITITGYSKITRMFRLNIPNNEVRIGLMKALIPNYIQSGTSVTVIGELMESFLENDINGALVMLQKFFKTVPYCNDIDHEGHWQQMLYVIFSLFGGYGDVEVHTSDGRVDLVMNLWGKLYLIETKLDQTAEKAMCQIDLKDYPARFAMLNLPIVKIGINFSTKERGITDWTVECC